MKILAISYLFPNKYYSSHGIFVLNRLKAISKYCEIKVINPIPWFPFCSCFKRYKDYEKIPEKEIIEGIEVFHPRFFIIPKYLKFFDTISFCFAALPLSLRILKTFKYDLIDLHWTYPDILSGRILGRILNKKQLVTIRGKEALHLKEYNIRSRIVKDLLPKSDFVIALSEELRKICNNNGVKIDNSIVIRNGVDVSTFRLLDKAKCRLKLGIANKEKIILSVGSLIYRKGFDRIIHSFPNILEKHPDAELYIIGSEGPEGDYRRELRTFISSKNLVNKVHFIGHVENNKLILWYNAADIFCLASRGEGSPNVLSEALACGCPSVTTNVGSVSEILSHNFMGLVVPNSGEKLLPALLSALTSNFNREKIAEFMQKYNWDWCARNVVKTYHQVLER